jgi:hypothetical protein
MAISLIHQDTCNRADGSAHGSTFSDGLGQHSSPASGQVNIDSNRLVQASNISEECIYDAAMSATTGSQRSVCDVGNADTGPVVCHDGGTGTAAQYYLAYFASLTVGIYIRESGGFTLLGSAGSASVNDAVGLEYTEGSGTLQARLNGSNLGSSVTNGTFVEGYSGWYFGGGSGQAVDNLEVWYEAGNVTVTPPVATLTLTSFAPTVAATDHQSVTVPVTNLVIATFAPTVTTTANVRVEVPVANLTTTTFEPTVSTTGNQVVTPGVANLTTTTFAPVVTTTDPVTVTPDTAALTLNAFAPSVTVSTGVYEVPAATLILTTFEPTVTSSTPRSVRSSGSWDGFAALAPGGEWRVVLSGAGCDNPQVMLLVHLKQNMGTACRVDRLQQPRRR